MIGLFETKSCMHGKNLRSRSHDSYLSRSTPPLQRLAPQVLVRLRIKADERQRYRYAAYMDARRTQRRHLAAWHFATVQISALRR